MEYKTNTIASRIQWCQLQKTQARTQLEREGWQSELEGLCDALLNRRVHTTQYQDCLPGVFQRYVIGFQDGQALIRVGAVDQYFATSDVTHRTHAGAHEVRRTIVAGVPSRRGLQKIIREAMNTRIVSGHRASITTNKKY